MVCPAFKTELEQYLVFCEKQLTKSPYKDERLFYKKAVNLTKKQLELIELGWDEIDIAKVSYLISGNSVIVDKKQSFWSKMIKYLNKFK